MANAASVQSLKQITAQKDSPPVTQSSATNAGSASESNAQKTQHLVSFSQAEINKKLTWYANKGYLPASIIQLQNKVGVEATGVVDEATILAVASWQKSNNLSADGLFGPASSSAAGIQLVGRPANVAQGADHDKRADEVQQGLSNQKFSFTAGGIAGIMGNMEAESHMNAAMSVSLNNGVDGGLCSWHDSRANNLRNNAPNGDWTNVGYQLDFLYSELTPELKGILTNKDYADNPKYCAGAFCALFERPMNFTPEVFAAKPDLIPLSDRSGYVKKSRFVYNPYNGKYYIDLQRRIDAAEYYYARYQAGAPLTIKSAEPAKPDSTAPVQPASEAKPDNTAQSVSIDVQRAIRVNKQYGYGRAKWRDIQTAIGLTGSDVDGYVGPITSQKIANWQAENGFTGSGVDGICGPKTMAKLFPDGAPTKPSESQIKDTSSDGNGKVETPPADNSSIPTQKSVRSNNSIYGHIDKVGSKLKPVSTPYQMYYDNQKTTIKVHEKVVDRVTNIFAQTAAAYTQEEIEELGLNKYSGCYCKRQVRGGSTWSIHSWAVAIDIDGARNPMTPTGKDPLATPKAVKFWEIVEANGGVSMGRQYNKDWMHFQFARFS